MTRARSPRGLILNERLARPPIFKAKRIRSGKNSKVKFKIDERALRQTDDPVKFQIIGLDVRAETEKHLGTWRDLAQRYIGPPVTVAAVLKALRKQKRERGGKGAARSEKAVSDRVVDRASAARELLKCVEKTEAYLRRGELEAALNMALGLSACVYQLTIIDNEDAIVAALKLADSRIKGGRARVRSYMARDAELALKYRQRFAAAAGSIRPSALKEKIGLEQKPPLSRSAAIEAIDRGLKILSGVSTTPDE